MHLLEIVGPEVITDLLRHVYEVYCRCIVGDKHLGSIFQGTLDRRQQIMGGGNLVTFIMRYIRHGSE